MGSQNGFNNGVTSYAVNPYALGEGGAWNSSSLSGGMRSIPRSFPDGQSNTIVFTEMYNNCNGPSGQAGPRTWNRPDGQPWEAVLYADLDQGNNPYVPARRRPSRAIRPAT